MPELPDITVYIEALEKRILRRRIEKIRLISPFLLRTVEPPPGAAAGRTITALRRIGKRIAFRAGEDLWLVLHLMIAGRLQWKRPGAKPSGRTGLAAFDFAEGTLWVTEAGSRKRASLHIVQGEEGLRALDPGGVEPLSATLGEFAATLASGNHTLKRALTDPRRFSGIGNAYSDEILHRAQLSPVKLTSRLAPAEIERLFEAVQRTLIEWIGRLRAEADDGFPEKVPAFREGMAVHGRYRQPCPKCGAPIQRIRYADNETNYCAGCPTGGKVLADRSLSRLLKQDWPRSIDELE